MLIATCSLSSTAPYSQSKFAPVVKQRNESSDEFEERVWRLRMHVDDNGNVFIPASSFSKGLQETAAYLGEKIQGRGNATYSKRFKGGIQVVNGVPLPIKANDAEYEPLLLHANPTKGDSAGRVVKYMPIIREWKGKIVVRIVDGCITREVFERHLRMFGLCIGIGRWRLSKGGSYGGFEVESIEYEEA